MKKQQLPSPITTQSLESVLNAIARDMGITRGRLRIEVDIDSGAGVRKREFSKCFFVVLEIAQFGCAARCS